MAVAQLRQRRFTVEEYLALERAADFKSEYFNGIIYAMAGSSPEHSAITTNITGVIYGQLADKPCQTYSNDMKVRASPEGLFAYPDLSVVCGAPQFHDEKRDVLINPVVIVEVLSDSTEAYDRGKKFIQYRHLDSLQDYLLIAQDEACIEHYSRQSADTWLLTTARRLDATLYVASIDCTLALAGIYRNVTFDAQTGQQI